MSDQRVVGSEAPEDETTPAARIDDLVITEAGDELLVYDEQRHHIHHLNRTSAVIWRLCDGRRSVAEVAEGATTALDGVIGEETVRLALARLRRANLLEGDLETMDEVEPRSRRRLSRRATIRGAIALPVVASMTAPTAAMAAGSNCPKPFVEGNSCDSTVAGCLCSFGRDSNGVEMVGTCAHPTPWSSSYNCMLS